MPRPIRPLILTAVALTAGAASLVVAGCGSTASVPDDITLVSAPPDGGPAAGQETPALGQTLVFRARVTKDGKPFGFLYGTKVLVAMPGEFGAPKTGAIYQNHLDFVLPDGAHALEDATKKPPHKTLGHVTSTYMSPTLGRSIAMALIFDGRNRMGQTLNFQLNGKVVKAKVVEPVFYDKEGARQNV